MIFRIQFRSTLITCRITMRFSKRCLRSQLVTKLCGSQVETRILVSLIRKTLNLSLQYIQEQKQTINQLFKFKMPGGKSARHMMFKESGIPNEDIMVTEGDDPRRFSFAKPE